MVSSQNKETAELVGCLFFFSESLYLHHFCFLGHSTDVASAHLGPPAPMLIAAGNNLTADLESSTLGRIHLFHIRTLQIRLLV